jgi:hypothetical protein
MSKVNQAKNPCCAMNMQIKTDNYSSMNHCKSKNQSAPEINVLHQCCFSSTTDNIYEEYTVVKVPEINKLTVINNISYQIDSNNFISSNDFQVKDYQINSPPIFLIDSSFLI